MAARNFKLVAYAVAVRIIQAVAIAVVARICILARPVFVRRIRTVVARFSIGTSCHFELVTDPVAVRIIQAHAVAVVTRFSVEARTVVGIGFRIVVARHFIHTARDRIDARSIGIEVRFWIVVDGIRIVATADCIQERNVHAVVVLVIALWEDLSAE